MKVIQKMKYRETAQGQKFNLIQDTHRQSRPLLKLLSEANSSPICSTVKKFGLQTVWPIPYMYGPILLLKKIQKALNSKRLLNLRLLEVD